MRFRSVTGRILKKGDDISRSDVSGVVKGLRSWDSEVDYATTHKSKEIVIK